MPRPVLAAEIVSRAGYNLPVGQADAVTRRISGYIAVNVAEDTRSALLPQSLAPGALTGNDPTSACTPHLRNVALESSCPALTKATAVRSSHFSNLHATRHNT
jgi:hypothetical protein